MYYGELFNLFLVWFKFIDHLMQPHHTPHNEFVGHTMPLTHSASTPIPFPAGDEVYDLGGMRMATGAATKWKMMLSGVLGWEFSDGSGSFCTQLLLSYNSIFCEYIQ